MYNLALLECELTCITFSISGAKFPHYRTVLFCDNTHKHACTIIIG